MGKKYNVSAGEIILTMVIIGVVLVIAPWVSYWCSYFGGWLASITIGGILCDSLNTLFGTLRFTSDMLPEMAGALGWIGGFFKAVSTTTTTSNRQR